MRIRSFGKLSDGRSAGLYILSNRNGMEVHLTDYGASIVRLIVPDSSGNYRDVVLGYDNVAGYEAGEASIGATVGRVANRISNASFDMNGRHYILTANSGPNTLHGGRDFYAKRLWSPVISFGTISTSDIASAYAVESMNDWSREPRGREKSPADSEQDSITFTLLSPDGDQGFPGDLRITLTYTLTDDNELHIDYHAVLNADEKKSAINPTARKSSDTEIGAYSAETWIPVSAGTEPAEDTVKESDRRISTPINLTNHSYFNLNGHDSGTVLMQTVQINAEQFTETDMRSVPTGTLLDVKWTPMDFRTPKTLAQDIDNDYEPLRFGAGYDHNYVLSSAEPAEDAGKTPDGQSPYREVACMCSDDSGIRMTVLTDLPGMQLYTANYLDAEPGKDGAIYKKRSAVCFETQFWPDTVNKENFPGGVLTEGEEFTSRTTYKFSVIEEN